MTSEAEYLGECLRYAKANSHDQNTQVGAVIVSGKRLVYAANRVVARIDGASKYAITEHAERAAIYKAAATGIPLAGATLYAPWFACTDCARGIVLAGIREVVGLVSLRQATPRRWLENIDLADSILSQAGVSVRWLNEKLGVTIRFDGRDFEC
jgi:dCMP deaminase